jgi:hypothetical protein
VWIRRQRGDDRPLARGDDGHRRLAVPGVRDADDAVRVLAALPFAALRKPVITLPMDIRIAAESARSGFVFTRRGIVQEAAALLAGNRVTRSLRRGATPGS